MNETGIIWTEATWNPMSGCRKISDGCRYCYAHTLAENKRGTRAFPRGFDLTIRPHKLEEPFKLKKPTLIFVNSMSDLFFEDVDDDYRNRIVDVIEATPQHEYQVLTKRPHLMLEFSKKRRLPANFWAGVSVENRRAIDRISILKKIKSEIKFLSIEPMLEELPDLNLSSVSWVITGGESGSHLYNREVNEKRAMAYFDEKKRSWLPKSWALDAIRRVRDNCLDQGVKFFHKQWGGPTPKSAGRQIDGKTWDEFPRLPGSKKAIENQYLLKKTA